MDSLKEIFSALISQEFSQRFFAAIGTVEKYDADKQAVDVQFAIDKDKQGLLIPDVPVIFPRSATVFIHFALMKGDTVQLLFNSDSIEGWLANGPDTQNAPHSLAGAVAIPGIFPHEQALKNVSTTALSLGSQEGLQIHIEPNRIRLGSHKAKKALALAQKVQDELAKITNYLNSHTHKLPEPLPPATLVPIVPYLNAGDVASNQVFSDG